MLTRQEETAYLDDELNYLRAQIKKYARLVKSPYLNKTTKARLRESLRRYRKQQKETLQWKMQIK